MPQKKRVLSSPDVEDEEGVAGSDAPIQCDYVGSVGTTGDGIAGDASNSGKQGESGELKSDVTPISGCATLLADAAAPERAEVRLAAVQSAAPKLEPSRREADGYASTFVESSDDDNASPEDSQLALADSQAVMLVDAPRGRNTDGSENAIGQAAEVAGDKLYMVKKPLHLGLSLRLGASYTAEDLRQRCRSNQEKLSALEGFLADPTVLSEAEAKGSKVCRGRLRKDGKVAKKEKSQPGTVRLRLVRRTPKRRRMLADAPRELGARAAKAAALPLSRIGAQILATAIGDPSTPAILRPEPRPSGAFGATAGAFVVGQTVWLFEAGRPPWPAQVVAAPGAEGAPPAYRVRPLGAERECLGSLQQPIGGDDVDVRADRLLAFVRGDALALALVADVAETLHERFVDGRARDAESRSAATQRG